MKRGILDMQALASVKYLLRYAPPDLLAYFRERFPADAAIIDASPRLCVREIVGDAEVH